MNVELPNEKPVDDDVGCSECGDVLDADGFCWTCAMEAEAERDERLRREEEEQRG